MLYAYTLYITVYSTLNREFVSDSAWAISMYLEATAILPQIYMFQRLAGSEGGVVEVGICIYDMYMIDNEYICDNIYGLPHAILTVLHLFILSYICLYYTHTHILLYSHTIIHYIYSHIPYTIRYIGVNRSLCVRPGLLPRDRAHLLDRVVQGAH